MSLQGPKRDAVISRGRCSASTPLRQRRDWMINLEQDPCSVGSSPKIWFQVSALRLVELRGRRLTEQATVISQKKKKEILTFRRFLVLKRIILLLESADVPLQRMQTVLPSSRFPFYHTAIFAVHLHHTLVCVCVCEHTVVSVVLVWVCKWIS